MLLGGGPPGSVPVTRRDSRDLAASACLALTCPSGCRHRPGPPVGLIRSLSAPFGRDPSQMCHSVTLPRPVPTVDPLPGRRTRPMPMLAEVVDAVVGIDTHRDTHQVEIALPTGAPIATCTITNDSRGYTGLLAWIAEHTPGPRLAVSIEGTRSYGTGVARAVGAAGLAVIECRATQTQDPPRPGQVRPDRRAPGRAVALQLQRRPAARPPAPTATATPCGSCWAPATTSPPTSTAQINRLRALLLRPATDDRPRARPRRAHRRHPDRPGPPPRCPATPPAPRPCATPRSAASPWPCARPRRALTANRASCRPSSTTSPPA